MSDRANALVNEVDRLLTLPTVYLEIRRIVASPSSDIIDVAKAISTDPALMARMLRIVNSPIFGQSRPVETATRAASLLGMNQVHDLCLAACLGTAFSNLRPKLMDVAQFWQQSLQRALMARTLAKDCGIANRERFFILGLLGDIGHMVMYMQIPQTMAKLIPLQAAAGLPAHVLERHELDCDYAEVGGALLRRWQLPEGICLPVEQQTEPRLAKTNALEAATLNLIASAMQAGDGGDIVALAAPEAWTITGLTVDQVQAAMAEGESSARGMAPFFQDQEAA
jgi:HD-like signal output (HDOD) protein